MRCKWVWGVFLQSRTLELTAHFELLINATKTFTFNDNLTRTTIWYSKNFRMRYNSENKITSVENNENFTSYTPRSGSFRARKCLHKWRVLIGQISWRTPPGCSPNVTKKDRSPWQESFPWPFCMLAKCSDHQPLQDSWQAWSHLLSLIYIFLISSPSLKFTNFLYHHPGCFWHSWS